MNPHVFRRLVLGPGVAGVVLSAASLFAANSVPNAPTVPPAPVMDRPLTPAANDVPGDAPSGQHVWVPGHWRWSEGAYVWEAGRWELPPVAGVVWHAPEWRQQGNGFGLKEGYWAEPAPQTAQVVPAPAAAAPAAQVVYADVPPPPPQREVIYGRPSGGHVWVPGYWMWRGGRHVWVAGRWELPPRTSLVWVPARWETRGGRYVFIEGHWREASVVVSAPPPVAQVVVAPTPSTQIVITAAPPALRHEVVYARPSPRHVWVPGYWGWSHGRHVWMAGHYTLPPRGHNRWEEPRWERRGGSYIFIEGRWR